MHNNINPQPKKPNANTPNAFKKIAENRAARHEYFILESYEAGVELFGTEVKSVRGGGVNLKDSWIAVENGEMYARHVHISPYEKGNIFNRDPMRDKRLLMHKREIRKLHDKVKRESLTLIPLSIYFKGSHIKIQVGLCKGKKLHDKRDSIAKREVERKLDRVMKSQHR
ncbi:MAG: SsrA-binding protein SmpB [Oscillospiraceae bacterium]|nr:SsrA-binding protein SmpB [Oscillospiraceae bacterium]